MTTKPSARRCAPTCVPASSWFTRRGRARASRCCARGFDAAIPDVMLPEMDGFELCRTIRKEPQPADRDAHRARRRDGPRGRPELGADDYLPKPFEPRERWRGLQTVLRRVAPAAAAPGRVGASTASRSTSIAAACSARARRSIHRHRVRAAGVAGRHAGQGVLRATTSSNAPARPRGGRHPHARVDILVSRLRRKLEPLNCIRRCATPATPSPGARVRVGASAAGRRRTGAGGTR